MTVFYIVVSNTTNIQSKCSTYKVYDFFNNNKITLVWYGIVIRAEVTSKFMIIWLKCLYITRLILILTSKKWNKPFVRLECAADLPITQNRTNTHTARQLGGTLQKLTKKQNVRKIKSLLTATVLYFKVYCFIRILVEYVLFC